MTTLRPDMQIASQNTATDGPGAPNADGTGRRDRTLIIAALVVLIAIGAAFRMANLGAIGFAEDEVNKVDAIRAYEHGDITANGEHPMLMKALQAASIILAEKWNESHPANQIAPETALTRNHDAAPPPALAKVAISIVPLPHETQKVIGY